MLHNADAKPLRLLTIAGSDTSGGAGIQADLQVFHSFAAYGLSAMTAITAQNSRGVQHLEILDADLVTRQLDALLADIAIDAVKIGMLGNEAVVEAVFTTLAHYPKCLAVLDPVLISSSGVRLLSQQGTVRLMTHLSYCDVLTPNSDELAHLMPLGANTTDANRARQLAGSTGARVVVTGGHSSAYELIIAEPSGAVVHVPFVHRDVQHTHGTGCVFSAALTAYMAQGVALAVAVKAAIRYVDYALVSASKNPLQPTGVSPLRIPCSVLYTESLTE